MTDEAKPFSSEAKGAVSDRPFGDLSAEEQQLYDEAWDGLASGDLQPLVKYLRSPFQLHRSLAGDLADCIEGKHTLYKAVMKPTKRGRGPKSVREAFERHQLDFLLGEWIERRLQAGVKAEAVYAEASELSGVSRTTVTDALARYRKARDDGRMGYEFSIGGFHPSKK